MEFVIIFIPLTILAGVAVWVLTILKNKRINREINSLPILSRSAQVVSKRLNTEGGGGNSYVRVITHYYVTFEFESGDRQELYLGGDQYGMLAERDKGVLMTQGPCYRSFQRQGF